VAVEDVAQIQLDAQGNPSGDQTTSRAQPQPEDSGDADGDHPCDQRVAMVDPDRVDRPAGEVGDQDRHPHRTEGEYERPTHGPSIRLQKAEETPEYGHAS